jgi:hypothetical protein
MRAHNEYIPLNVPRWSALQNERKTCPSFAESVQAAFRTSPRTNPQRLEPPCNIPVRLVTFSLRRGLPDP